MFHLYKYIPRFAVIFPLVVAQGVWTARADTLTDLLVPDFICDRPANRNRIEAFSGVQARKDGWASYAGLVWAPCGDLDENGPRLRIFGGWGEHGNRSDLVLGPVRRRDQHAIFEAMPGYQWRAGPFIVKLYAGLAYEDQAIAPPDPGNHHPAGLQPPPGPGNGGAGGLQLPPDPGNHNPAGLQPPPGPGNGGAGGLQLPPGPGNGNAGGLQPPPKPGNRNAGGHWGPKAAIGTWLNLGANAWLAADASYSAANDGYAGSVRAGYRMLPWLSVGPEVAAFGDSEHDAMRAGAFAQFHVLSEDVTISGGMLRDSQTTSGPYGALSFHRKF